MLQTATAQLSVTRGHNRAAHRSDHTHDPETEQVALKLRRHLEAERVVRVVAASYEQGEAYIIFA